MGTAWGIDETIRVPRLLRRIKVVVRSFAAASVVSLSFGATWAEATGQDNVLAKADLITQELQELRGFVGLCKSRISLLQELRIVAQSGYDLDIPPSHQRMLTEQLPLLSGVELDVEKAPLAASNDYLILKAVIPQPEEVSLMKFITMRSPRSTSTHSNSATQVSLPSSLLAVAQSDGTTRLFTPSGEMVLTFSVGHDQPVTVLATPHSHDEYLVITGDEGGVIKVHKINVRQRRIVKGKRRPKEQRQTEDEKQSQYFGMQVNVTHQFVKEFELPTRGQSARLTTLSMAGLGNQKFFVAGDSLGRIYLFTKNGTLRGSVSVFDSQHPLPAGGGGILSLHFATNSLMFLAAGGTWGFLDIDVMRVRRPKCPNFAGSVRKVAFDSQQSSRILVSDEAGIVTIVSVKKDKDECKLEHRFRPGTTRGNVDVSSVRGYALALESGAFGSSLVALNMSHVGRRMEDLAEAPSPVVWKRTWGTSAKAQWRSWAVQKRPQQGDLIALLSADGRDIEVYELLMAVYTAPAVDNFSNFKFPVIAVAVLLVLGYQYMKNKGGSRSGGIDATSLFKGGRRGGGLGKFGGLKGSRGAGGFSGGGLGGSRSGAGLGGTGGRRF